MTEPLAAPATIGDDPCAADSLALIGFIDGAEDLAERHDD